MVIGGQFVFDAYDRKARLVPALLAIAPLFLVLVLRMDEWPFLAKLGSAAVALGGLWLLTDVARSMGKSKEAQLYRSWGGKPSVQLLRHSNAEVDGFTKMRYHACLSKKTGTAMPTPAEENDDPRQADARYDSASRWLLDNTRDKARFPLLASENITYGFRRNGYGIRAVGLLICALTFLWGLVGAPLHQPDALLEFVSRPKTAVSLLICVVMAVLWLAYFRATTVRTAAFTYANELLRSCERLAI
ncbi:MULTISPECIES: hypothetical protein [Pandoraea]|uniref:hypothetical protein n=1 Tax=Pandoraea TaxID=93217 RepID=UPI001F5D62D0|nr:MULTISPECIES: hypothetical protein [Pandoraea]MCI3206446.1 hypothetical protein [Pandoraea sp. LA3]MDN4584474.1 hypothetical protein [Pandoraea capi]